MQNNDRGTIRAGFIVFLAYVIWGLMPFYWKAMQSIDSSVILGHRAVWSVAFTMALLLAAGKLGHTFVQLKTDRRTLLILCASSVTIALNWFLYIYAVNHGRIMETSLGYFINPLVSVAFGMFFFKERLRRAQKIAITLAACGVGAEVIALGELPLMSLGIALTFGLYGVFKKQIRIDAAGGLFVETAVLMVPALVWLYHCQRAGISHFPYSARLNLFLIGTGVMTSVPLILFAWGAQRIRLSTLGLIQYTSPILTLLIAVFAYGEPFTSVKFLSFGLIWTAIILYTAEALIVSRHSA